MLRGPAMDSDGELKPGHLQPLRRVEPTGIEPETSCLQNGRRIRSIARFHRFCSGFEPVRPRRLGGIRRDQARFGQQSRAAAQRAGVPPQARIKGGLSRGVSWTRLRRIDTDSGRLG